jgi:tyrosine aminotransferase
MIYILFQGAIAQILENTKDDFFSKILNIIREAADICYDRIKEIPCLTCPYKPEGSMSVMVKTIKITDFFSVST